MPEVAVQGSIDHRKVMAANHREYPEVWCRFDVIQTIGAIAGRIDCGQGVLVNIARLGAEKDDGNVYNAREHQHAAQCLSNPAEEAHVEVLAEFAFQLRVK